MDEPLITLTTDFGTESPYVAAMKGVILGINPRARFVDLTHQVPPQDIRYTAFFLAAALPYFPAGSLHVVVVDPGVGTARALLYVELGHLRLLVPDNGCWTELGRVIEARPSVIRLAEPRFWRESISSTFHGRDILAPVAGHLSRGIDPNCLGPPVSNWIKMELPSPVCQAGQVIGEIVFIDHFGNMVTNIQAETLQGLKRPLRFMVGNVTVDREVRTYGEAKAGTLVALPSSADLLEFAVSQGNAASQLGAKVGMTVKVQASP
jgi:S-adenosyl-L-methionine hydrolase (adenosine-forming)